MAARHQPPHPALRRLIQEGDAAVVEVVTRASQRMKALLPSRLPAWGTPEAEALRLRVGVIARQMYRELAEVVAAQATASLAAGLRASNEETAAWLARAAFLEEFEPETLEAVRGLVQRAEAQRAGLEGALERLLHSGESVRGSQ